MPIEVVDEKKNEFIYGAIQAIVDRLLHEDLDLIIEAAKKTKMFKDPQSVALTVLGSAGMTVYEHIKNATISVGGTVNRIDPTDEENNS